MDTSKIAPSTLSQVAMDTYLLITKLSIQCQLEKNELLWYQLLLNVLSPIYGEIEEIRNTGTIKEI